MGRLLLVVLALGFLVGIAGAIIARRKGRDPALWFLVGAVFGLFAVLGYGLYTLRQRKGEIRGK